MDGNFKLNRPKIKEGNQETLFIEWLLIDRPKLTYHNLNQSEQKMHQSLLKLNKNNKIETEKHAIQED